MPKPERENQNDYESALDLQKIATQILIRQNYKNSRTAYPICEEYLHRIRAIAILGEIPSTNVINNILIIICLYSVRFFVQQLFFIGENS